METAALRFAPKTSRPACAIQPFWPGATAGVALCVVSATSTVSFRHSGPSSRAAGHSGMFLAPKVRGRSMARAPCSKPGWAGSGSDARTRISFPVGTDSGVAHNAERTVHIGPTREELWQPARHDGPKHPSRIRPARFWRRAFRRAGRARRSFTPATEWLWCDCESPPCNKLASSGPSPAPAAARRRGPDASADPPVPSRTLSAAKTARALSSGWICAARACFAATGHRLRTQVTFGWMEEGSTPMRPPVRSATRAGRATGEARVERLSAR